VRRFELRRIDFAGEPPSPRDVEGIAIRGFRPEEARRLYEAHIEAFGDHWGAGMETYEDFRHHQLDAPDFDAGMWFVAWDGDEVAGYIGAQEKSREDPSRGYIPVLGVRRPYRRRGLGEALLRTVFGALHARGSRGAELHVDADSVTGATRLYERVGMSAHPRFATWEKELRPGGPLLAERKREEPVVVNGGTNCQLHWESAEGLARKPLRLPFLPLRLSHRA
jgi:ribosomal protein S18 acetylase RimI-like enzyme